MYRFFEKAREPINSFTHFLGVLFAIIGASLLLGLSVGINFSPTTLASVLIFCLSMVLLYSASSWYHYSNGSAKVLARLRKLDHDLPEIHGRQQRHHFLSGALGCGFGRFRS